MVRERGESGGGWRLWAIVAREGSTGTIGGRLAQGVLLDFGGFDRASDGIESLFNRLDRSL